MTVLHVVTMSRVTQSSKTTQLDVVPRPSLITRVPPEIIREIFKFVVFSSEEARSHEVKTLCLVDKDWNDIANTTSDLWTKITLAYPLHANQFSAARKWLKASEPKVVDVDINLCDPTWSGPEEENWLPSAESLQGAIEVLRGSEHRWESISIKSDAWIPIQELLRAWVVTPCLPALESIVITRTTLKVVEVPFLPLTPQRLIEWPALFGGNQTLMPKLLEVALCAVPVVWTSAAATSFQNLRVLSIREDISEAGPTFEQFSAALSVMSPRLETLSIGAYYQIPDDPHTQTQVPFVRLPALKHLIFGWTDADLACCFLEIFQIPETLETLWLAEERTLAAGAESLSPVFDLLFHLGSEGYQNKDPSRPWISMRGLKIVGVTCMHSDPCEEIAFLQNAPMIEEILLEDVSDALIEATAILAETRLLQSLKCVKIIWNWSDECKLEKARLIIERFQGLGLRAMARLGDKEGRDIFLVQDSEDEELDEEDGE